MTTVVVRPGAPDEYTIPFTHGWERRQIVGRMRRLKVEVSREEARAANLNAKVDRIELPGIDTVRLTDVQTGGASWVLTGYSAEWDANRAGFTPGGDVREGDDAAILTELIGEVDSWTAGSIADLTGPLSFVFSHAHRHEALRRIETNVPGEIRFRDFGTVDYVDRLGSDRSGSVTLSPDAGTIEGSGINITERGRELDGTHIRVLGAHEGEAQLFVNLVPEDDPETYDNEVRYSTPRWTEAADTDWDRWSDNDITDQSTLETEAESIGEELAETLVKAETTVPTSVGLNVGDTVRVVKDDADLDRDMRVHRLTRRAGTFNDSGSDAAVVDKVHLSTRTTLQTDDDAELEEIRKFNTGFQGSSVAVTGGPVIDALDNGQPLTFGFRYPDLEFENSAELLLRGDSYRIDSQGAADGGGTFVSETTDADGAIFQTTDDGGGFSETTTSNAQSEHGSPDSDSDTGFTSLVGSSSWVQIAQPVVSEFEVEGMFGGAFVRNADEFEEDIRFRINVGSGSSYWPSVNGARVCAAASQDSGGGTIPATGSATAFAPVEDGSYELEILYDGTSQEANVAWWYTALGDHSHDVTISRPDHNHQIDVSSHTHGFDVDIPNHTHAPQPGIYTTGDTPSNVDVEINGSTVATDVGSGTFETVVDIAGELNRDAWNTITIRSDSLGRIAATPFIEGYDQIGKR